MYGNGRKVLGVRINGRALALTKTPTVTVLKIGDIIVTGKG
jgi:hypothetical protein